MPLLILMLMLMLGVSKELFKFIDNISPLRYEQQG
jgi:hypothetical protein